MVGRRPRFYTSTSKRKLLYRIASIKLRHDPSKTPEEALREAREALVKHERIHGRASTIYHALKPRLVREYVDTGVISTADLGHVRALIQKVVAEIVRSYEALNRPLRLDEIPYEVFIRYGVDRLGLPEEVATDVVISTLNMLPTFIGE